MLTSPIITIAAGIILTIWFLGWLLLTDMGRSLLTAAVLITGFIVVVGLVL